MKFNSLFSSLFVSEILYFLLHHEKLLFKDLLIRKIENLRKSLYRVDPVQQSLVKGLLYFLVLQRLCSLSLLRVFVVTLMAYAHLFLKNTYFLSPLLFSVVEHGFPPVLVSFL